MAASNFRTTQYSAEQFVESGGAIPFHILKRQVCIVHYPKHDEWYLAKGRRNIGESRADAALREVKEETGFECDIMRLDMMTRAPPAVETLKHYDDIPRLHSDVAEPFMVTHRLLKGENNIKIIWWFMAAIRGSRDGMIVTQGKGDTRFRAHLLNFDDALARLTYKQDQDILSEAIKLFEANKGTMTCRNEDSSRLHG